MHGELNDARITFCQGQSISKLRSTSENAYWAKLTSLKFNLHRTQHCTDRVFVWNESGKQGKIAFSKVITLKWIKMLDRAKHDFLCQIFIDIDKQSKAPLLLWPCLKNHAVEPLSLGWRERVGTFYEIIKGLLLREREIFGYCHWPPLPPTNGNGEC